MYLIRKSLPFIALASSATLFAGDFTRAMKYRIPQTPAEFASRFTQVTKDLTAGQKELEGLMKDPKTLNAASTNKRISALDRQGQEAQDLIKQFGQRVTHVDLVSNPALAKQLDGFKQAVSMFDDAIVKVLVAQGRQILDAGTAEFNTALARIPAVSGRVGVPDDKAFQHMVDPFIQGARRFPELRTIEQSLTSRAPSAPEVAEFTARLKTYDDLQNSVLQRILPYQKAISDEVERERKEDRERAKQKRAERQAEKQARKSGQKPTGFQGSGK